MRPYKIIVIGDANVGKTSIVQCLYDPNVKPGSSVPTIGAEFRSQCFTVDGQKVRLQIWDTAGQEKFTSLLPMFLRNADGCIIVIDVNNPDSITRIELWKSLIYAHCREAKIIMVGNKVDLPRHIPYNKIHDLATNNNYLYMETTICNPNSVVDTFQCMAELMKIMDTPSVEKLELNDTYTGYTCC